MTLLAQIELALATSGVILAAMALLALVESAIPLHPRVRWNRAHLGPNLALTFMTFGTNTLFNAGLVMTLVWLQSIGFGLLQRFPHHPVLVGVIAVLMLDFSFYFAHVAMHNIPGFWRFHSVHHSDPAVDVTTTIRQHPGEGVIRYVFMAAFALALGVSPGAFAVYRAWSALHGLLEHANIRMPLWLDSLLVLVVSTPNMHKVHHSRAVEETDSNYSNLFSLFDRLFGTFTPSRRGVNVACGLDGFDDPATQRTLGLLAIPFRSASASGVATRAAGRQLA